MSQDSRVLLDALIKRTEAMEKVKIGFLTVEYTLENGRTTIKAKVNCISYNLMALTHYFRSNMI
jgi:D-mannonate dehydratase